MTGEGASVCTSHRIPQPDGLVPTPTCYSASIGTECDAIDTKRMPGEGACVLPRHCRMVLSSLPLAMVRPSGLNTTLLTEPV